MHQILAACSRCAHRVSSVVPLSFRTRARHHRRRARPSSFRSIVAAPFPCPRRRPTTLSHPQPQWPRFPLVRSQSRARCEELLLLLLLIHCRACHLLCFSSGELLCGIFVLLQTTCTRTTRVPSFSFCDGDLPRWPHYTPRLPRQ